MKFVINKILIISLLILSTSVSQASDIFSHTVLTLPDDPRNEASWSRIINT